MDLSKRREEIVAEHRAQEKYDPHWLAEAKAGRPLSERPIAFLCDDEVVLVGEDVATVLNALHAFVEKDAAVFADPQAQQQRSHDYRAFLKCRKLLAQYPSSPAELRMHQQAWTAVTYGLTEVGVLAVVTEGTFGG